MTLAGPARTCKAATATAVMANLLLDGLVGQQDPRASINVWDDFEDALGMLGNASALLFATPCRSLERRWLLRCRSGCAAAATPAAAWTRSVRQQQQQLLPAPGAALPTAARCALRATGSSTRWCASLRQVAGASETSLEVQWLKCAAALQCICCCLSKNGV